MGGEVFAVMANEFTITTKEQLASTDSSVSFKGTLLAGETVMTKLSQMLAVQMPEPGGDVEKVQQFVTKAVPAGKTLTMYAQITCKLVES